MIEQQQRRCEEIRGRAREAAPGPWRAMSSGNTTFKDGLLGAQAEVVGLERPWNPVWVGWQSAKNYFKTFMRQADAEFVAHAREDVPWLLAALDAKDAELLALRAANERLVRAVKSHDAEVYRLFGDVRITHTGRAGRELQELLDAAAALAASPPHPETEGQ